MMFLLEAEVVSSWISWIILGLVLLVALVIMAYKVIQIIRMPKEEREEVIKQWLISAIVAAEATIKESGAGKEKLQMVLDNFKQNAPVLYKFIIAITKNTNIEELIEQALTNIKENFGNK